MALIVVMEYHCALFITKSFLYIYIKYMISKHILQLTFLNKPELIFLHTVKRLHLFLSNKNKSIYYKLFVST